MNHFSYCTRNYKPLSWTDTKWCCLMTIYNFAKGTTVWGLHSCGHDAEHGLVAGYWHTETAYCSHSTLEGGTNRLCPE